MLHYMATIMEQNFVVTLIKLDTFFSVRNKSYVFDVDHMLKFYHGCGVKTFEACHTRKKN